MKDFLWKLIHNRIRCSTFFARIPTLTNRQYCHCGAVETIEHIFFECDNSCQSQIWPFAELLWNKMSKIKWVTPNLNLIKAIGCICISDAQGNYKTHTTSIYQTIVMVTIWHIWKACNKMIFNNKQTHYPEMEASLRQTLCNEIRMEYGITVPKEPFLIVQERIRGRL